MLYSRAWHAPQRCSTGETEYTPVVSMGVMKEALDEENIVTLRSIRKESTLTGWLLTNL